MSEPDRETAPAPEGRPPAGRADTATGFGRTLVFVYGIFAVAATSRSAFQLIHQASVAPLAYSLSAFSGVVYILATYALSQGRHRLAIVTVATELVGVVAVGALSIARTSDFPDQTVWSDFGSGYGYVPLVLPMVGLWWLWRTSQARSRAS